MFDWLRISVLRNHPGYHIPTPREVGADFFLPWQQPPDTGLRQDALEGKYVGGQVN
jgi:hypothetical protein